MNRLWFGVIVLACTACSNAVPDLSTRQSFANAMGQSYCQAIADCCGTEPTEEGCAFAVGFYEGIVNDASVEYQADRAGIYYDHANAGFESCELSLTNLPLRGVIPSGGSCGGTFTSLVYGCAPGLLCQNDGTGVSSCVTGPPLGPVEPTDLNASCS